MKIKRKNKKGIETEMLVYMIIAVVIMTLLIIGYFAAKGKVLGAIEYIKTLFRFRS